jgi:CheY-like chemotaxis protein
MTSECGHILLVDDDAEVRDALQSVLEARGFTVRTASNGASALESLAREPAAVVLLDLMMPVMSGAEMLERLRVDERLGTVPVVITTAWPEQAKGLAGAQGILPKPIDFDQLLGVAARYCNPVNRWPGHG